MQTKVGNVLYGSFRLKLRGHTTEKIPYNAAADKMKSKLESLPSIGTVDVTSNPVTKERGYS